MTTCTKCGRACQWPDYVLLGDAPFCGDCYDDATPWVLPPRPHNATAPTADPADHNGSSEADS